MKLKKEKLKNVPLLPKNTSANRSERTLKVPFKNYAFDMFAHKHKTT